MTGFFRTRFPMTRLIRSRSPNSQTSPRPSGRAVDHFFPAAAALTEFSSAHSRIKAASGIRFKDGSVGDFIGFLSKFFGHRPSVKWEFV